MSDCSYKISDKRPLSPHLTIYKPQVTSVLSILHRLTGVGLFFGLWLLAVWLIMNVYGCADCINPLLFSTGGRVLVGLWSFALFYHLLNGVRHLFWDAGLGYSMPVVTCSGVLVVIGAVILTALAWFMALYGVGR